MESGLDLADDFLLGEFSEVAHGLLAVELEEGQAAVLALAVHHLAAVRLVAVGHAVGYLPVEVPAAVQGVRAAELCVPQGVGMGYRVASKEHVVLGIISVAELVVFHGVLGVEHGEAYLVVVLEEIVEAQQACQVESVLVAVVGELVHVLALGIDVCDVGVVDVLAAGGYGGGGQEAELVSVPEAEGASSGYRAGDVGQGHRLADVKRGAERVVVLDVLSEIGQAHVPYAVGKIVVLQQPSLAVGTIGVGECGSDDAAQTESH